MAKKARSKKGTKLTAQKVKVTALTPNALKKKLGAKRTAVRSAATASSPIHTKGSAIIAPGPNGTTIVCFFNDNTGNFDDCHTVPGRVGIVPA